MNTDDSLTAARGLLVGVLFSLVFWALVLMWLAARF
jgi:hypothetical protein